MEKSKSEGDYTAYVLDVVFLIFGKKGQEDYITQNILEGLAENDKKFQVIYIASAPCVLDENFLEIREKLINCQWIFTVTYPSFFPATADSLADSPMIILDLLNSWDKCVYFDATEWRFDHKPCWGEGPRNEPFNFTYMKKKCKAYFKRECYPQDFKEGYWPFPYSFSAKTKELFTEVTSDFKKVHDVFCSFPQSYTGLRERCIDFCRFLDKKDMFKIKIATGLDRKKYVRTLAGSMITLDGMGAGHCNTRFFEATPNFTAVFRQKYEVVIPYEFDHSGERGKEMIVEYNSEHEMKNKILNHLLDPDNLIGMAYRSRAHALKYHTCKARVGYIFDVIEGGDLCAAFAENPLLKN